MSRRAFLIPTLCALAVLAVAPAAAFASTSSSDLQVGSVRLHRCDLKTPSQAWCGSVSVPLDYTDRTAPSIKIGFGWIPATQTATGTVVAQEGGPGYPSTGTAPDYAAMFGTLLRSRNLLVVDARGTGRSEALDCEPLQSLPPHSTHFAAAVAACGHQLNHTFRRADGSYVHASDLFSTANSARDLARVLHALRQQHVDLYGDSYGTYFAQSFLSRYSGLLRSVVLDSAYEARDLDPWYITTVTTARRAFDAVCRRAPACPAGPSWSRITRLARILRAHPLRGRAVGTDAKTHAVTVGSTALVDLVNDAGYDYDPYRQLDAAARAYLDHGDATPLLRLYLQDVGYDYSDYNARAAYYSDGLYMAVACTDYPQLFDMRSSPAQRRAQLNQAITKLPAGTFAPFTTREWIGMLPYTETYTGCLTWPAPTHRADPPVRPRRPMDPAHVPVLILNGELDSLTPAAGGAHVRRQIGPDAQAHVAANTVHLVALDNPHPCGAAVVRHFVTAPHRALSTSCLAEIPAIHAVDRYPRRVHDAARAAGSAPQLVRRLATVALDAAGDELIRYDYVDGERDLGLRGGTVRYDGQGDATLRGVRFTVDSRVSGTVRTGRVDVARLTVRYDGGTWPVTARWNAGQRATVTVDRYRLTAPAP